MTNPFPLAALIALAVVGTPCRAQERSEDDCLRLHPAIRSPVEMVTCTSDIMGSKQALDAAMSELRARVPADYRSALDKVQRAWIVHRDTQCRWEAGGNPGSTEHSSAIIGCMADMNRKRADYLRDEKDRW